MVVDSKKIFMELFLFLVVFAPPVFHFNIIFVLSLISVMGIAARRKRTLTLRGGWSLPLVACSLVYILAVVAMGELFGDASLEWNRLVFVYQLFVLIPLQFLCAYYVDIYAKENRLSFDGVADLCIMAGVMQSVLVVLSYLFPAVQSFFLNLMIYRGNKTVYENIGISSYRSYGFADTLLDTFGYGMGILAGCCLLKEKQSAFSLFSMAAILFSVAVNSRTGIAVFFVALFVKMVCNWRSYLQNGRCMVKLCAGGVLLVVVGIAFVHSKMFESQTVQWITAGFESVWSFFTGRKMQYRLGSMQNSLFGKDMWAVPERTVSLLFGEGHSIFGTKDALGVQSDVGYINYIWVCGIIGTALFLLAIGMVFFRCCRESRTKFEKQVMLFLAFSFFLVFIKGNVLTHTAGTFLTILCIVYIYRGRNQNRNWKKSRNQLTRTEGSRWI